MLHACEGRTPAARPNNGGRLGRTVCLNVALRSWAIHSRSQPIVLKRHNSLHQFVKTTVRMTACLVLCFKPGLLKCSGSVIELSQRSSVGWISPASVLYLCQSALRCPSITLCRLFWGITQVLFPFIGRGRRRFKNRKLGGVLYVDFSKRRIFGSIGRGCLCCERNGENSCAQMCQGCDPEVAISASLQTIYWTDKCRRSWIW